MLLVRAFLRSSCSGGGRSHPRPRNVVKSKGMLMRIRPALARCYQIQVDMVMGTALASSSTQSQAQFCINACNIASQLSPGSFNFSTSSQVFRRRNSLGDEHAVERHFAHSKSNPINKYLDTEENSTKSLEEIAREQTRKLHSIEKARAVRYFREDRENSKRRALSWDTIDQIRYLRQENPTEWSVAMLAESFNVSAEVIVKVLKSKFAPSSKVREKQDHVVEENTGYQPRRVQARSLVESARPDPSYNSEKKEHKQTSFSKYSSVPGNNNVTKTHAYQQKTARSQRHADHIPTKSSSVVEEMNAADADMEFTFGKFDFENIDSMMGQVTLKPQVFKKGRNFYNENGEFLYRI